MSTTLCCPLCKNAGSESLDLNDDRRFYRCSVCLLLYVSPKDYLSTEQEKAHYDLHQNSPQDIRYRRFLNQLAAPLVERLPESAEGLDFGSGPGPTLNLMLGEAGYPTAIYDVFYANELTVLTRKYDFITASEVIEHLRRPDEILPQLWGLLRPKGYLAIMTQRWDVQTDIAAWRYKSDPTHVIFFARATFEWLRQKWSAQVEYINNNVTVFQKK